MLIRLIFIHLTHKLRTVMTGGGLRAVVIERRAADPVV